MTRPPRAPWKHTPCLNLHIYVHKQYSRVKSSAIPKKMSWGLKRKMRWIPEEEARKKSNRHSLLEEVKASRCEVYGGKRKKSCRVVGGRGKKNKKKAKKLELTLLSSASEWKGKNGWWCEGCEEAPFEKSPARKWYPRDGYHPPCNLSALKSWIFWVSNVIRSQKFRWEAWRSSNNPEFANPICINTVLKMNMALFISRLIFFLPFCLCWEC